MFTTLNLHKHSVLTCGPPKSQVPASDPQLGDRAFAVRAPQLWNRLPEEKRFVDSVTCLLTVLFIVLTLFAALLPQFNLSFCHLPIPEHPSFPGPITTACLSWGGFDTRSHSTLCRIHSIPSADCFPTNISISFGRYLRARPRGAAPETLSQVHMRLKGS